MVTDGHPVDFFVVSSTMLGNVSMFSWFMRTWLWHYIFYCSCDTQCAYRALLCSVVVKKNLLLTHFWLLLLSACHFISLGKKSLWAFVLSTFGVPSTQLPRRIGFGWWQKIHGWTCGGLECGNLHPPTGATGFNWVNFQFLARCHFHFCFRMRCHVVHWEGASRTPVSSQACSFIPFSLGQRYWSSNTQLAFDITSLIKNRDCRYLAQDERLAREFAARRLIGVTVES